MRAVKVEYAQFMGDQFGDLAKDVVQFLKEKNEPLNVSLGDLRALAGGSAQLARDTSLRPLVDLGAHLAVSTSRDVSLPVRLPLAIGPAVAPAPLYFSLALASSAATPVVIGVAGGSKNIEACPYVGAGLAEKRIDSDSDLRPLVQPNTLADQPDPSVSTPCKANPKKKTASSGKSPRTCKKPAPVFGKGNLRLPPYAGPNKKASSSRSKSPSLAACSSP